ncbi:pyridoxal phosphate-dependent transferase [Cristinia sonorae]|uniref:Pyridoxal phosphate-dependent transferase n=1 Tax=Cristinia sonorae TaxID=1940300 RepID=A0A8K0ULC4_9AGAR|nr:pyridoxal phosphate-dependent transferase [Cristinia sonorae]
MPILETRLRAALQSREERCIRRRLSDPATNVGLVDFHTNDYLSLSSSEDLRSRFLTKLAAAPNILGSGGSRLLVNGAAHHAFETRLASFFGSPCALLFNSGFDANVGFFSCVPQAGDVVVFDEYIHASVHDGIRASRAREDWFSFEHNSLTALGDLLLRLIDGRPSLTEGSQSIFVAVESLYSMDGTIAPLLQIVEMVEAMFPRGNGYVIVDEAHATGIYGPQGRGLVALLGLEDRVLARLHTFGKALAGSGGTCPNHYVVLEVLKLNISIAVVLTNTLIRDYMLNYARSLIYTTSLCYANIIAVDCAFDMLEDGTAKQLSRHVLHLSAVFTATFTTLIRIRPNIPLHLLSLSPRLTLPRQSSSDFSTPLSNPPTPIIAVFTSSPRPLSAYLRKKGMNACPITWPTVPKGKDRVRVCLHAGNTEKEVEVLAREMVAWAEAESEKSGASEISDGCGLGEKRVAAVQSKL